MSRDVHLDKLRDWYGIADFRAGECVYWASEARSHWNSAEFNASLDDLITAVQNLDDAVQSLIGRYNPFYPDYGILYWLDNYTTETATVDMDGILNAMLAATFDQLKQFVGISDAYKVAVWDAPYNEQYYAALARGFREWGVL